MDNNNKKKNLVIFPLIIVLVILAIFFFPNNDDKNIESTEVKEKKEDTNTSKKIEKISARDKAYNKKISTIREKIENLSAQLEDNEPEVKVTNEKKKKTLELGNLYAELISIHEYYKEYDNAIDDLNILLEKSKDNGNDEQKISLLTKIAYFYMMKTDFLKSAEYHKKALEYTKKSNNDREIAYAYHNLGQSYYLADEYKKASDAFLEALFIYRNNNNEINAVDTLNALSNTHMMAGRLDDALLFQMESLYLNIRHDNKEKIVNDYTNLGIIYHLMGDSANSCKSLSEGYNLAKISEFKDQNYRVKMLQKIDNIIIKNNCNSNKAFGLD